MLSARTLISASSLFKYFNFIKSINSIHCNTFSTMPKIHHIIATDPCYVTEKEAYEELVKFKLGSTTTKINPSIASNIGTFVNIPVTESLHKFLSNLTDTSHSFDITLADAEDAYVFGEYSKDISNYDLVGCHGSDSRLTCLVASDAFSSSNPEYLKVDWSDFVLTTLNDPELQVDRDNFPVYLFFGKIPNEDNFVAVFGLPDDGHEKCYKGILIRSYESCVAGDNQSQ